MDSAGRDPYAAHVEPSAKRFRVMFGGATIADTVDARLLFETGRQPVIYFPPADVAMDALAPSAHVTRCPHKGAASHWTLRRGGKVVENAAWTYRAPEDAGAAGIAGLVGFQWNAMDAWMEEDSPLLGHARDPHKRIDTLPTTRAVTVIARGKALAQSRAGVLLFETGLPLRPYLPRGDIAMTLLRPSATRTVCPYKGVASYFDAVLDGATIKDVAWCYETPFPEVGLIKGMRAF
ncbi:MAG: DUF427 domain-containing protein [Alphaproteobacteria bacterium]|nr:DUF427 domain-containing protein [Alphaproteobacteria bacterium]